MKNKKDTVMTLREIMVRLMSKILDDSISLVDSSVLINMLEAFEKNPKNCFKGIVTPSFRNNTLPPPGLAAQPDPLQTKEDVARIVDDSPQAISSARQNKPPPT